MVHYVAQEYYQIFQQHMELQKIVENVWRILMFLEIVEIIQAIRSSSSTRSSSLGETMSGRATDEDLVP